MRRNEGRETITELINWDRGQTASERLAGKILKAEGFDDIDPSHPAGGPDGGKDFLCSFNGIKWIGGKRSIVGVPTMERLRPKCGHPMTANIMGLNGIACPDCGFNPYVFMILFCECGEFQVIKSQPEMDSESQIKYVKEYFLIKEKNCCDNCKKNLFDEYLEARIFYAPVPYPYNQCERRRPSEIGITDRCNDLGAMAGL